MFSELSQSTISLISRRFFRIITFAALMAGLAYSQVSNAGDAGCGLGSVIIQKNSKGLQILAWTTNSLFLTQPLGIISGTSGCSSSGIVKNDKQIEYFVEVNHDDLTREMADGRGEKLNLLAQLHGCSTADSQAQFAALTQKSFDSIVSRVDVPAEEIVQNLEHEVKSNADLVKACKVVTL